MIFFITSEVVLTEGFSCGMHFYADATVMFSELMYTFEEGVPDFDVCVMVVGESDDSTCPVEFSIQITVNMNGMYMVVLKFFY